MSNIKLIKAEIERMHQQAVLAACGNPTDWLRSRIGTCVDILAFIDSLPEDHFRDSTKMISEDLEEAADKFAVFMQGVAEGRRLEREEMEENKRKEDELPRFYGD